MLVLTREGNGMKLLVMSVFVVALNISFCVRLAAPVYIPVWLCQPPGKTCSASILSWPGDMEL